MHAGYTLVGQKRTEERNTNRTACLANRVQYAGRDPSPRPWHAAQERGGHGRDGDADSGGEDDQARHHGEPWRSVIHG